MRTKILNELEESYKPYSFFWNEWKQYKFNGLTQTDLYMVEVQVKNNFIVGINDFVMFYNQLDTLRDLTKKLKENYIEFQDWLIMKFQFSIIKFSDGVPIDLFFRIPLKLFYGVAIGDKTLSIDLISILQKFSCQTLQEIFTTFSDKDFRNTNEFAIITEFQSTLQLKKNIYKPIKEEALTINWN